MYDSRHVSADWFHPAFTVKTKYAISNLGGKKETHLNMCFATPEYLVTGHSAGAMHIMKTIDGTIVKRLTVHDHAVISAVFHSRFDCFIVWDLEPCFLDVVKICMYVCVCVCVCVFPSSFAA